MYINICNHTVCLAAGQGKVTVLQICTNAELHSRTNDHPQWSTTDDEPHSGVMPTDQTYTNDDLL